MASPAELMATVLQAKNVGHTTNPTSSLWAIKVGRLMNKPDEQIALIDSGGFNPNTKWLLDFVTVQALIRSGKDGYPDGYAKAQEVKDALLGLDPQSVGSGPAAVWWSGVTMLSDIAFLKHDEQSRALFSINFRILQERPTNALTNRQALDDPS
jgi:hypothetical protein